jgi:hypothetical protein
MRLRIAVKGRTGAPLPPTTACTAPREGDGCHPLTAGCGWSPPQRSGSAGSRPPAATPWTHGRPPPPRPVRSHARPSIAAPLAEWLGPRCPPGTTSESTATPAGPRARRTRRRSRVAGSPPSPWPSRGQRRRQTPRGTARDPATVHPLAPVGVGERHRSDRRRHQTAREGATRLKQLLDAHPRRASTHCRTPAPAPARSPQRRWT